MRSLFAKLSLVFLVILLTLGLAILWLSYRSSQDYILEFTQKLNRPIAMYMAESVEWVVDGELNPSALEDLTPHVMMINPSLEVYLLDASGQVISPTGQQSVQSSPFVDMHAISKFLAEDVVFPVQGSHPGQPGETSIFSVWPIVEENTIGSATGEQPEMVGYVYVILGSQKHESLLASIQSSYSIRDMLLTLTGVIVLTLCGGLVVFFMLTRRLRKLADAVSNHHPVGMPGKSFSVPDINLDDNRTLSTTYPKTLPAHQGKEAFQGDEIDLLQRTYDNMTQEIVEQYHLLEHSDVSRREFIASISHDLRTPLTSLQNYLETVLTKWNTLEDKGRYNFIENARRQTMRLQHLIAQLFEISKLNSPDLRLQPEKFSMLELAYDCAQDFEIYSERKKIKIEIEAQYEDVSVYEVHADIALMQRVLENLISNAIRHTPEQGRIRISLEEQDGSSLCIMISDTGCGLSREQKESFHKTGAIGRSTKKKNPVLHDKGTSHTGIGLSIVQRILDLHESSLQLSTGNKQHTGTSFFFVLPNTVKAVATSRSRAAYKRDTEEVTTSSVAVG
ncbi:MAG: HAMP domain-containing histidine kinase [Gammaproteobacteria bacterium]|nr:HAMP domain-containing histidine kinase [Gammaproteobacteria bacterium]